MQNVRVNFILKKPGVGRKSFSILRKEIRDNAAKSKRIKLESIDAINKALQSGFQDVSQCEQAAKEVVKSLYRSEGNKYYYSKTVYNSHKTQTYSFI